MGLVALTWLDTFIAVAKAGHVMERPLRVLIADAVPRARAALAALLSGWPDIDVVGAAANGSEVVQMVWDNHPDVVVLDVNMPLLDGLEATRAIRRRQPATRVIVLTLYADYRSAALAAGADAFLLKGCPIAELARMLRQHQANSAANRCQAG
jgi:DNA-binding NarL/FixJ family response regulator